MGAVGYDLHSVEDCIIQPGERRCVGTGLAMCFPPETYGRIAPRSGLAVVWGIQTGAGIIDRQVFFNATKTKQNQSMLSMKLRALRNQ